MSRLTLTQHYNALLHTNPLNYTLPHPERGASGLTDWSLEYVSTYMVNHTKQKKKNEHAKVVKGKYVHPPPKSNEIYTTSTYKNMSTTATQEGVNTVTPPKKFEIETGAEMKETMVFHEFNLAELQSKQKVLLTSFLQKFLNNDGTLTDADIKIIDRETAKNEKKRA